MMKLPNLENLLVEKAKIADYLLSQEKSSGKSAFYLVFGFTLADWEILKAALIQHATTHEVARSSETAHGIKYIIEGKLQTPDGRSPQVRSVWIIDRGKDAPRLVTAYPLGGDKR
ncbi:hypothetical protein HC928_21890 [bacterium]|nr:hypothetical protein [bacterium]